MGAVGISECFVFPKETNGGWRDVWHFSVWSDFVSREGLLRSDYLGRTKCFCWWRVAVISGSWEIDRMHRPLAHWSQPQHWQSMAWLVMHKNEVKWATCESASPSLPCVVNAPQLFVSFVLTSLALEWLIISIYKVRGDVCVWQTSFFSFFFVQWKNGAYHSFFFTAAVFLYVFKWEQNFKKKKTLHIW